MSNISTVEKVGNRCINSSGMNCIKHSPVI